MRFEEHRVARGAAVIAFWLAIWQLASVIVDNPIAFCGPLEALGSLLSMMADGTLVPSVVATMANIVLGFLVGSALGILGGACGVKSAAFRTIFDPIVLLMKSVPVVCVVAVLLLWFSPHHVVVVCVVLVSLPLFYAAIPEAALNRDGNVRELLRVIRAPAVVRIVADIWPSAYPPLYTACKTAMGMSWKAGVAAELIGIPFGTMGASIYQAKITLSAGDLFAWVFVVVALAALCESGVLALLRFANRRIWRIAIPKPTQADAAEPSSQGIALSVKHAQVAFEGGEAPVIDVAFEIAPGRVYVLNQPSGAGKTTFIRAVLGLTGLTAGAIEPSYETGSFSASVMFQAPVLFGDLDAVDNVRLFAGKWMDGQAARDLLSSVLESDILDRPVSQLSGGQRRRVELCRALAIPSDLVVLDEPFAGLDEESARRCARLIAQGQANRTVIIATHNMKPLSELSGFQIIPL